LIDPVIFTIRIGGLNLAVYWYGVIIMAGVWISTILTAREVDRRGGDGEFVWDALLWVLPAGIVGARIWYVLNDILGGGRIFVEQPLRIFNLPSGGLHIYGAILFGLGAAILIARRQRIDLRLILDAVAPGLLLGQAIGRIGNFINQELYGPPTELPWGIPIDSLHRLPPWNDLALYPEATTRFHPTFAYEILWNMLAIGLLLWVGRRFAKQLRPGTIFAGWMILAGIGRFVLEWFRPDQPRIPGTEISYTRVVALLLFLLGLILALLFQGKLQVPGWQISSESYRFIRTKKRSKPK
jgi:phosphatidylglycerol:prolipoprotein diacylglycerol transferase